LKIAIEIVNFPIKHGGSFHSYVNVYQRVLASDKWILKHLAEIRRIHLGTAAAQRVNQQHPSRGGELLVQNTWRRKGVEPLNGWDGQWQWNMRT